ncbi:MAG: acyltransferase, partial [bacterium]
RQDHWLANILSRQPFRHIGMVSYGMYLMHLLAYHVVARACRLVHFEEPISLFVLTALATIAAATLSFRYYESYFQKMKTKVEAKFK